MNIDLDDERAAAGVEPANASEVTGETVAIVFQPSGLRFQVAKGEVLFEAAVQAGVEVDTVCGGNGSCGKCKVRFDSEAPQPCSLDYVYLSGGEIQSGYRLSCQVKARADMVVEVPDSGARAGVNILHHGVSRETELQPNIRKMFAPYQNPRKSDGVADWDRLKLVWPRTSRPHDISLRLLRQLPAAIRREEGMTIVTAGRRVIGLEAGDTTHRQLGAAFDIGSTTIVGFLVDLGTGKELAVASAVNRQAVWGDDIIGRLSRAQRNPDGLAELQSMVLGQITTLLDELIQPQDGEETDIHEVTVVGNMAMHHFLLGLDSTYLGLSPYAPVSRDAVRVSAEELALKINAEAPIYVLANIAGFVGSDLVAAMLASGVGQGNEMRMVIDVGTNGEMALGNRKKLMACSAPAGPALEGARIQMGMRAAPGAIDHVWIEGDVRFTVIGDAPATGICGSALIDIVAQLLDAGLLGESGAFIRKNDLPASIPVALLDRLMEAEQRRDTYFVLARIEETGAERDIIFTQQDVREMQLAKGAIRAGTMILMQKMGLDIDDLAEVMLSGAFGNFINAENALRCGLTPPVPIEKLKSIGNAAGVGAKVALVNVVERRRSERLAEKTEHIQLSGSAEFQKAFTEAMQFAPQKSSQT
jgi:uncharacterized 2Fe-2S/4Fe-4S cluster protein (DUF4445 family)